MKLWLFIFIGLLATRTFCNASGTALATNVTSYDRDGKLSANNYTSNPGQGFGNDNGTLNQYFGIVAGIQTTIQTTADLNNGNSFVLGTDNLYDPNTVLGYAATETARLWTLVAAARERLQKQ